MLSIVVALLILLFASCAAPGTRTVFVTETPTPQEVALPSGALGPFNFPPGYDPLTGLRVDDPAVLKRRPLAVKISNAPDLVRPQAGIGEADLVFEHYVEGSLTRFTAIFRTHTPPRVGSVRSARLIDLEIPSMYSALFAYSGASEPIRQRIAALPFAPRAYEGVSSGPPLFYRDTEIEVPHNLFIIPAEVWKRAETEGQNGAPDRLGGMVFSAAPPRGAPAQHLTIDYGPDKVRWDYERASGRYLRSVDGQHHTDANTGVQVSAANVVLIYAYHQPDTGIVESEWQGHKDYSLEIQIWTLGPAVVLRNGQMVRGFWIRWEEEDLLSFWADEAGTQAIPLKPGNTWFEVVPLDFTAVQIQE